jgi:hypothetical protein
MRTPYLPAFRSRLAALGRRSVRTLRQTTLAQFQEHLHQVLPYWVLSPEDDGPNSRQRVFSLRLTFECFVWQVLKPNTACREVVRQVQAALRLSGRGQIDEGDSAYVQARQRLPKERLEKALDLSAEAAQRRVQSDASLQGRPVMVADGSSTQLADTPSNQQRYPQPKGQKPGCGFPVMKFVALFSLCSGAIVKVVTGSLHHHDVRLLRTLWPALKRGDILLGDRAFGEYGLLSGLPLQGVDVIARAHHARKINHRQGKRLGPNDRLLVWNKGWRQTDVFSPSEWDLLPKEITVRVLRFTATIRGFRNRHVTLVTTLLDAALYPAEQIIAAYARRWRLELCFGDLKTTMGMEQLRCKSPEMAEKELLAYLVAHNLIRCVMAQAVDRYPAELERLSFKGTIDALRQYSDAIAKAPNRALRRQLWDDLLFNLVRDQVRHRPNRREPRAVKRRPKPFPILNKPRRQFREIPHRNRYWRARPRNHKGLN